MNLQPVLEQRAKVEEFTRKHRIGLLTLLFTDLVGSTKLKQELGDRESVALIQRHHGLVRDVLGRFKEGEEIGTAGDSFFIVFAKPSDAVQFSLMLQAGLRGLSQTSPRPLLDRVGIHIGEVVIEERPGVPKPKDMYGLQVDICARVMSLAEGDQILLTRSAFDNARQVLKGQEIERLNPLQELQWSNHGPYLLKGVEEPMEVCEVGEAGAAVLKAPPDSEKVHRYVSPDAEPVLGWRPALDQKVAGTQWALEEKLGEGGFGEVWLGRHTTTKERRVFKFCFRADRVRALKREVTLFRLLRERVGEHPNVVRLKEVFFDEPPYYIEMEYVEGRDLKTWCEARGGVGAIPLETRLEIVAQVADALQAAHDAGVIHRDVKPSNILMAECGTRSAGSGNHKSEIINHKFEAKLTDFGIGQVVSEEALAGVTRLGFTETLLPTGRAAQAGTYLYMAPELLAGKPASKQSDIYSLGVVLYQLLVGDLSRPITTDWSAEVEDPILREDLTRCTAANPQNRFASAAELAKSLRGWQKRRLERELAEARKQAEEEARQRHLAEEHARQLQAAYLRMAELLYVANLNLAQQAWEQNNIGRLRQLLEETRDNPGRGFEWYYWQRQSHLALNTLRGHAAPIKSVAFSPDGLRIVTGSADQTAKVWEAASGRELFTLQGHSNEIEGVAFSPDGQRIVTGSFDGTAKVWDAASGLELLTLHGHFVSTSPALKKYFQGDVKHSSLIFSVAFSPDGQRIATGSMDETAKVWDAASGRELLTLKGGSGWISSVAFSPDGQRIVAGSTGWTAKVWDVASGRELLTLHGHSDQIGSVAFSPDGERIVTGGADNTAKVWDAASGRELLTLRGHSSLINSVAFSPDGLLIVTGSADQTVKVWEAGTGRERVTFKGHSDIIHSVAFSSEGRRIVTGSQDQTAKVWEAPDVWELLEPEGPTNIIITAAAFSPDGQCIVTTGSGFPTAKVWDAASGRELLTLHGQSGWITCVAFSLDGQRIVTGSMDETANVKVWDAATGRELLTFQGPSGLINSVAFSPDGERIVTGSDGGAKVWEAASGRELLTFITNSDEINSVADPAKHAVEDIEEQIGIAFERRKIHSVAFSPDGQRIVTGSGDKTAKVWEAATGRELLTLQGHGGGINSVSFSPDGQRVATGSEDKTAKVWELASGRELLTLQGHSAPIRSVAFSPDGQRIVTGSDDHTVRVWEASSGRELLTLQGHSPMISSVAFSPDGQRIITANGDGRPKVWEAATKEQVAAWQKEDQADAQH